MRTLSRLFRGGCSVQNNCHSASWCEKTETLMCWYCVLGIITWSSRGVETREQNSSTDSDSEFSVVHLVFARRYVAEDHGNFRGFINLNVDLDNYGRTTKTPADLAPVSTCIRNFRLSWIFDKLDRQQTALQLQCSSRCCTFKFIIEPHVPQWEAAARTCNQITNQKD